MKKMFIYQVFLKPPTSFNPTMEAAGCYCTYSDKCLLVKRQPFKSQGNKWGVPGGKLEQNESPLMAVIREIREEVGLDLSFDRVFKIKTLYIRLPPIDYIFHMFYTQLTDFPSIELDLSENQEARWSTLQEALRLPLVAAGKEALLYYKSFLSLSKNIVTIHEPAESLRQAQFAKDKVPQRSSSGACLMGCPRADAVSRGGVDSHPREAFYRKDGLPE